MFELHDYSGTVRVGEEEIRLSPKSSLLFRCLLNDRGKIVSRKNLFAAAWPDQAVTDAALNQAISQLRRELGEPYRAAIRTIPRLGFVLDCPMDVNLRATEEPVHPEVPLQIDANFADIAETSFSPSSPEASTSQIRAPIRSAVAVAVLSAVFVGLIFLFPLAEERRPSVTDNVSLAIIETAPVGLSDQVKPMLVAQLDATEVGSQKCDDSAPGLEDEIYIQISLDTAAYAVNALTAIPYNICIARPDGILHLRGEARLGHLSTALQRALASHMRRVRNVDDHDREHERAIAFERYAAARDLESSGKLAEASTQYEEAMRSYPGQPQIALDYGQLLTASGNISKAILIFGQIAQSTQASAAQRTEAAVSLAEIEGRFADAANLLKGQPRNDRNAARLFENLYSASDPEAAAALIGELDSVDVSRPMTTLLKARLLGWSQRWDESDALLQQVYDMPGHALHGKLLQIMAGNDYQRFRQAPDAATIARANARIVQAARRFDKQGMFIDAFGVRLNAVASKLPITDACMLLNELDNLLREAESAGAPRLIARTLHLRSWARYRCGSVEGADADLSRALAMLKQTQDVRRATQMQVDLAYLRISGGRLASARAILAELRAARGVEAIEQLESRIARLEGRTEDVTHPCESMLITRDDTRRRALVGACIGAPPARPRPPNPTQFHAFMETLHHILTAARCDPGGCTLDAPAGWSAQLQRSEPRPRRMMLEDFAAACRSLQGVCDAKEIREVLQDKLVPWKREGSSDIDPSRTAPLSHY